MANYVHDENHNRVPAYSAEEFLSLLAQVIESGDLDDVTAENAFITKLKSIINGNTYSFAVCTQAEYNALVQAEELQPNTLYIISDDSTVSDIQTAIAQLQASTSANIEQLQEDVGELQGDVSDIKPIVSNISDAGKSIPVSSDGLSVAITKTGLYSCQIRDTGDNYRECELISIPDLNLDYIHGGYISYSPIDKEIYYAGQSQGKEIEFCHLIVPYGGAQ